MINLIISSNKIFVFIEEQKSLIIRTNTERLSHLIMTKTLDPLQTVRECRFVLLRFIDKV